MRTGQKSLKRSLGIFERAKKPEKPAFGVWGAVRWVFQWIWFVIQLIGLFILWLVLSALSGDPGDPDINFRLILLCGILLMIVGVAASIFLE